MEEEKLKKEVAENMLNEYVMDMKKEELSDNTIVKYVADIKQWLEASAECIEKTDMLLYKETLCKSYKMASVNSKIISINRYLKWLGLKELIVKTKRIQPKDGLKHIITKEYYFKMLDYAKNNNKDKIFYIMKTIAQTGIRIGELKFITIEAIQQGATVVWNKGKYRTVYFNEGLCEELLKYCIDAKVKSGIVFLGKAFDKPITPGAVWKNMKYIAKKVGVPEEVVYPHSFRHLFAKEYMRKIGDISELADLLGHSRLETTWIYTKTTAEEKREKLKQLDL